MKTTPTETVEKKGLDKKSQMDILLILSATVFAIVCAISIFFFFENMRLSASIEANNNEIADYTKSIEKIQSDKKVIAAELVVSNKPAIQETIKTHEVQTYIDEILNTSRKYKILLSGFSYENGKINTSAVSMSETVLSGDDGIKKVSELIRDYRTGSGTLFNLAPVLSISGYEQKRTFSIEFNVGTTK